MNSLQIPAHLKQFVKVTERKHGIFLVKTYAITTPNHTPDDYVYQEHPELIPLIPRGCSDLYLLPNTSNPIVQLRGMDKFDGTSSIDEDELDGAEVKTITDHEKIKQWESSGRLRTSFYEKANGKFVIAKVFEFNGQLMIFGGSKNVHVPIALNEDVSEKKDLHFRMLHQIQKDISACENKKSLVGTTILGEYVDGMHMVYVDQPYMVYFNSNLPATFPATKKILESISTVPLLEDLQKIREMKDIEGVVIYYENTETGELIRQKHKTIWYIVIRCWREVISHKKKENFDDKKLTDLVIDRLKKRSDDFLHLSTDAMDYWSTIAVEFCSWLYKSKYTYADLGPFSNVGMAKIWKDFTEKGNVQPEEKVEIKEPTIADILVNPEYYTSVLLLAETQNVAVIMSGIPGTGKSTITDKLIHDLAERKISVEVFSTDKYFINDKGEYKHDVNKLGNYHKQNQEAFKKSTAQVKIVDNTNLVNWEFKEYVAHASNNSYVCVVLQTIKGSVEEMTKRNLHFLKYDQIERIAKKYTIHYPMYVGCFASRENIAKLLKGAADDIINKITQKTPLHVTCKFVGGKAEEMPDSVCGNSHLGSSAEEQGENGMDINVTGYSENKAGLCLVVDCPIGGNHITLSTNATFKPVDVGKTVTKENTVMFDKPLILKCVVSPMF
jgi:gluconate kinase